MQVEKFCTTCKQLKAFDPSFGPREGLKSGFHGNKCRACYNESRKGYKPKPAEDVEALCKQALEKLRCNKK